LKRNLLYGSFPLILLVLSVYATHAMEDPNRVVAEAVSASLEGISPVGAAVAIVSIPGPASSTTIVVHIYSREPLGIRFVSLSFMKCKSTAGDRIIIGADGVFNVVPPPGGTVTVYTPDATHPVPVVLVEFTGFDITEEATFQLDPDTFGDPLYGAQVRELKNILVQLWFENGKVSQGKMVLDAAGNLVVLLP